MSELGPPEIRPPYPPVVPIPQNPFIPKRRLAWLVALFPGGQFLRYIGVGCCNTIFGYTTYVIAFTLLNSVVPSRFLYLATPAASIATLPLNITFAYFGYKLFVFRTQGNYLREWLKCFAVYGVGMVPGLVVLAALTRALQSLFHRRAATLHPALAAVEHHLSGRPLTLVTHLATGPAMAGYIAGALVMGASTIYSFVGHKKVTFKTRAAH